MSHLENTGGRSARGPKDEQEQARGVGRADRPPTPKTGGSRTMEEAEVKVRGVSATNRRQAPFSDSGERPGQRGLDPNGEEGR